MGRLSLQGIALDDPARAAGLVKGTLDRARQRSHAFLCSYALSGDVLALGRHHVVPAGAPSDVQVLRRMTGGRPAPLGEGYVAMALALPHGQSLVRDDPPSLPPERVLNRAVRGLLGALERLGVQALYPGRDVITVGGRIVGALGIDVVGDGAVLVEGCIALARSFAEVTRFLDRADPLGVVPMDLVSDAQATSVVREGGRAPDLNEWSTALGAGFAARLGLEATIVEAPALPALDPAWREAGLLAPHLDRHASTRDLLGVVTVYAARDGDRIGDVRVCGDLVGPSTVVTRVEGVLRGAPLDRETLRRLAREAAPDGILGVRTISTVADLAYEACTR